MEIDIMIPTSTKAVTERASLRLEKVHPGAASLLRSSDLQLGNGCIGQYDDITGTAATPSS